VSDDQLPVGGKWQNVTHGPHGNSQYNLVSTVCKIVSNRPNFIEDMMKTFSLTFC